MYRKVNRLTANKENLGNYIEGVDVYNSLFVTKLLDPNLSREQYIITTYEYRPDLIAKDYYGSEDYLGILLVQTGKSFTNLTRGTVLRLLPKSTVDQIIKLL